MDDLANALPTFLTDDIDNASVVSTISTGRPVEEVFSHASAEVLDLQNLGYVFLGSHSVIALEEKQTWQVFGKLG